jgi:hypothetical protein
MLGVLTVYCWLWPDPIKLLPNSREHALPELQAVFGRSGLHSYYVEFNICFMNHSNAVFLAPIFMISNCSSSLAITLGVKVSTAFCNEFSCKITLLELGSGP